MSKQSADEAPREQPRWRSQVESILETQIARSPFLLQGRAVLRQLRHERESWPLLLPLLIFVFVRAYRQERRKVLAAQREIEE
jgi:hypothetical protein